MMDELLIWLSTHPDVEVRFNQDPILNAFKIRVIKGRYTSAHMMDEIEREIFLKNDKGATELMMSIISYLYGEIEKEEEKHAIKF